MQPTLIDHGGDVLGTPPPGFSYAPRFLGEEEQRTLLKQLEKLDYEHDLFRGQRLKRGYAQFGCAYVSIGRKLDPAPPIPEFLAGLIEKASPCCPEGARFNQCIVTRYPKAAGIGWHTDAPCFGDCIIAVSLGGEGRLQFRPAGAEEVTCEILAASGSLYVMRGPARRDYQHQVLPVDSERYSLTFRCVVEDEKAAKTVPP